MSYGGSVAPMKATRGSVIPSDCYCYLNLTHDKSLQSMSFEDSWGAGHQPQAANPWSDKDSCHDMLT